MSFYNKYRPQTFEELHSEKVRALVTSLLSKKKEDLPHAFLLTGPKGIGKTTTARLIAKFFNCISPKKNGEPCGTCELCVHIAQGNAMDVLEMDAASNTGVDNIRDLKDKIMLAPSQAVWKIYIIDEVHMLSTGAFNALLKTLEEPPAHTVFILATTDPQKIPETIQSRCLQLPFKKPEISEIVTALSQIVKAEKFTAEIEALELIAVTADGSFRDATKLLEQASLTSKAITKVIVESVLSVPEDSAVATFLSLLQQKNMSGLVQQIESFSKSGVDVRNFYIIILKKLQQLLVEHIVTAKKDEWRTEDLRLCLKILLDGYGTLRGSSLPDLALELAVLSYCSDNNLPPVQPKGMPVMPSIPLKTPPPEKQVSAPQSEPKKEVSSPMPITGGLSIEQWTQHWNDFLAEVKTHNHSVSGVLRSTRPKSVENGIVTVEAFYAFHKDKLSETKAKDEIANAIKILFGEKVKVDIVLGKK